MLAAVIRHRLGEIVASAAGERLKRTAAEYFQREGVVNPARMVAMLCPGFRLD
jgi:hypothetical protein